MFFNQIETHFSDSSFEIKEMGSINKSHVWQEQFSVRSRVDKNLAAQRHTSRMNPPRRLSKTYKQTVQFSELVRTYKAKTMIAQEPVLMLLCALSCNRDAFGGMSLKMIDVHAWLSVAAGLVQLRSRPG